VVSPAEKRAAAKKAVPKPATRGAGGARRNPRTEANDRGAALGLQQDRLNKKQLKSLYSITARQLRVDDDLFKMFQKAYDEQWDKARWDSEIEQLPWYRKNRASIRNYMMLEAEGGADFAEKQKDSYEFVRRTAMQLGVNLSDETLRELAEDNLMYGWGESGQTHELERAIVEKPSDAPYGGDIRKNADTLRAIAHANGVSYSENWYESAGKSVASTLSNPEDWENMIRDQAAQKFGAFGDQIRAGMDVIDIASPYVMMMQDEWEINGRDIDLSDPTLLGALTTRDDKGNWTPMNLGDFQRSLRKDPRWMTTDKAQNKVSSIAGDVMKMFGLTG
jgi:hypothetical protein